MVGDGSFGTGRLEAFSDGVFAIAITLLILEIRLPHLEGVPLSAELLLLWPSYVAYALSFVTIGIMWANHHRVFRLIDRTSHGLIMANLLLLTCVAFVPFPTGVLAEHLGTKGDDTRTAAIFFSGTFLVTAVCYTLFWFSAAWGNRLIIGGREAAAARVSRRFWYGIPGYLTATLLALWNVEVSLLMNAGLAALYFLPGTTDDG